MAALLERMASFTSRAVPSVSKFQVEVRKDRFGFLVVNSDQSIKKFFKDQTQAENYVSDLQLLTRADRDSEGQESLPLEIAPNQEQDTPLLPEEPTEPEEQELPEEPEEPQSAFAEACTAVEAGNAKVKAFTVTKTTAFEFSDTVHGKFVNFRGHGTMEVSGKKGLHHVIKNVLFVYRKTDTAVSDPSMQGAPRSDTDRVLLRKDQDLSEPYGTVSEAVVRLLKGIVRNAERSMKRAIRPNTAK